MPPGRLLAPLLASAVLLAAAPADAAPNPFLHDLDRVDGHLRVAIESGPEELGETLRAAEIVCGLGERASAGGEADLATADWATLTQLIDQEAVGESLHVKSAFADADAALRALRERFERRWAAVPDRLRELRGGVAGTRRGIAVVEAAVARLSTPFANWRAHECDAAPIGVEKAFARAPTGLELINSGMLRLWRLAIPAAPPTARR